MSNLLLLSLLLQDSKYAGIPASVRREITAVKAAADSTAGEAKTLEGMGLLLLTLEYAFFFIIMYLIVAFPLLLIFKSLMMSSIVPGYLSIYGIQQFIRQIRRNGSVVTATTAVLDLPALLIAVLANTAAYSVLHPLSGYGLTPIIGFSASRSSSFGSLVCAAIMGVLSLPYPKMPHICINMRSRTQGNMHGMLAISS